ncbi:SRPBCC family protein [Pedobacter sp.]|uniref:SRPBCC family protein n=1 Tax=Pedobacter sp. TaxID=1411316 RepID=UPI003D7FCDE4
METQNKTLITVETTVNAPVAKVWEHWNEPMHIRKWNFADDSWHCPGAENDLRIGGRIQARMEAKDQSQGFDFWGIYDDIKINELISYTLGDGRKVNINFKDLGEQTKVTETFEAEDTFPKEMQKDGWQRILNNFKKEVEGTF